MFYNPGVFHCSRDIVGYLGAGGEEKAAKPVYSFVGRVSRLSSTPLHTTQAQARARGCLSSSVEAC